MQKITPFLWFDKNAEEAMNFYTSAFNNAKVVSIHRYPKGMEEEPMKNMEGKVLTGVFELEGQQFMCLDGGPYFKFNPSVSFSVSCRSTEDVEMLYKKLGEGGTVLMPLQKYPFSDKYVWFNDKFGVSWQISTNEAKQKITPSFMFTGPHFGKAEEAINFYTSVFKNSTVDFIARYEKDEGDEEGKIKYSSFTLEGQNFSAMESSKEHDFQPNPSISQYINCKNQEEVDYYWERLSAVREAEQCGWVVDKYGFSWQIIPESLPKMMTDHDPLKAKRVTQAMLKMKKIIIEDLEKAFNGE